MRVINLDKLSSVENRILNMVAVEIRADFNALVETVGLEHENNIDWIVSSIASRNKYLSPLFLRCCYLALVKRILETDQDVGQITLADRALSKVLQTYFKGKGIDVSVVCTESISGRIRRILTPFYHFAVGFVTLFLRFIGRSKSGKLKISSSVPITLLDTFVIKSSIGEGGSIYKGKYKDRYYTGLLENLGEKDKRSIFYYPALIGFGNPVSGFKLIRNAKDQFIIPDDFLNIWDYLFILLYPMRICRLQIPKMSFLGFDVAPILRQERRLTCCNFSSFLGLLNYRFAFRMSQEKVQVKLLVDWHENQVIDRGLIVGFRRFHPETHITGYQGYIISKNLHIYIFPTPQEYRSQAVPHKIGVIGKGLLEDIQEFCNDFEAIVAPAFRFNKVWEKRKKMPDPNMFTILVALPIGLKGSANILRLLASVLDDLGNADLKFWIKPHPTCGPEQIKPLLNGVWPEIFHFKTGDFNECVEGANLLIGNASSTCLEAMAKGVPVIVIGDRNGIVENPIPETITSDIWKLCYSSEEVAGAIQFCKNRSPEKIKEHEEIGTRIREEYFEPVTREGARKFLGLQKDEYEAD